MKQYLLVVIFAFLTVGSAFVRKPRDFSYNDFQPKSIENPSFDEIDKPSKAPTGTVNVNFTNVVTPVSKYLFLNNANIYMSQMVDQPVLINNIKTLSPKLFHFPVEISAACISGTQLQKAIFPLTFPNIF